MPNVRIGEAFHKLDGTPYGKGKSLFEIGVHDGKGSIADAKSILGLMSLDYTHPVMLVSENEKELQRVYEAIS